MFKLRFLRIFALAICSLIPLFSGFAQEFSTASISKFSFPSELTSALSGNQIAWAMNEQGKRNVYWAVDPDFKPERLTDFMEDDGQEISSIQFSPDCAYLVFVRGGDHGGGNASQPANVMHMPLMPKVEIWQIELQTKAVKSLIEGDYPSMGPAHQMVFLKNNQIWKADLTGKEEPAPMGNMDIGCCHRGRQNEMESTGNTSGFCSFHTWWL